MNRLICSFVLSALPLVCWGQEELNDNREILVRKEINAAMSEPVYRRLSIIHDQMGEDKLTDALENAKKLQKQRLSKYEKALVTQTLGFVYSSQGNQSQAIKSFEESLKSNSLPATAHQGMLYSLAGLLSAQDRHLDSIKSAREWFRYEASPKPEAYMLIAASFAELERFDDALPYVLKAISKSEKPVEAWHMLALAIRLQKDQFKPAAALLVTMLQNWPDKPRYWEMLSGCYLELQDDKNALDTMMLAYNNKMITKPAQVKSLAQLSLMRDIPYSAGIILDDAISVGTLEDDEDNLKLLLQSWLSAREYDRAVAVINRLSPYAEDGRYFLQAAQIYNELGEWAKVVDNTNKALDAGLDKSMDAMLLSGTAYSELDDFENAIRVFEAVKKSGDSRQRRNAESWMAFVREKQQVQNARIQ
jgi:tetratricopeptide (TPR) repeat protein